MTFIGIDFGTTNTAVAVAGASGPSQLVALGGPDGASASTWRTILYFDESDVTAGSYAIARYLAGEGDGRLVQSIKSHLASRSFAQTTIAGRSWTLERLVARFLIELRGAAAVDLGRRAVVGRPVRYWGSSGDDDDARAIERMTTALRGAGFDEVVFEPEPIAAAAAYAARLDHDELILVADIGGGGRGDLCNATTFNQEFSELASRAFGARTVYFLRAPASVTTLTPVEVRIDSVPVTPTDASGNRTWWFDNVANAVVFEPAFSPQPGQVVELKYSATCY